LMHEEGGKKTSLIFIHTLVGDDKK
jgi:hypothetical protein